MKQVSRRSFLNSMVATGCVSSLSLSLAGAQAVDPPRRRPNILFAMADDWGWPHAGAYGDPVVKTPAFDRIATEGVLFDHAYISTPSCTPCRNAILTGQQFYRLGPGANLHGEVDVQHPNFMFMIREQGYEIGHWRKAWGPGTFERGGYEEHPCGPGGRFDAFMEQRDTDKPFCFWFGTSDPHRPYELDSGRESGIDIDAVPVPSFWPNNDTVRSDIADYYFEVQRWDSDVGEALALLEEAGELENTIVVMTGDHGMPFPRCKANLYDWGTRVPLVIRWGDRVKPNRRVTDFVSLTDLAPTFLELAGVAVPDAMTGKSLLPVLEAEDEGRVDTERDFMVFGRERHVPAQAMPSMQGYPARALRTDQWLLIWNLESDRWPAGVPEGASHRMDIHPDCDDGPIKEFLVAHKEEPEIADYYALNFGKRPEFELYDCVNDPDQINNLAGNAELAETVAALRAQLLAYLEATNDPRLEDPPVKLDEQPFRPSYQEELSERLAAHGYEWP